MQSATKSFSGSALALVMLVALVFSACSSPTQGSAKPAASTSGSGASAPAASAPAGGAASSSSAASTAKGDPIKVGVLHSLSGTMSISETSVRDATLMAIDELNAK